MRTRNRTFLGLALVVGLAALIPLTQAAAGGVVFGADLNGANEVPGPGDPDGTGSAIINADSANATVCFDLSWTDIGRPIAAHIHRGGPNVAGPVRVELFAARRPLPRTIDGVSGCIEGVEQALVDKIIATPERFYVNVHNVAHPSGAIRGQLALLP